MQGADWPHWDQLRFNVLPMDTSDMWTAKMGFKPPNLQSSICNLVIINLISCPLVY